MRFELKGPDELNVKDKTLYYLHIKGSKIVRLSDEELNQFYNVLKKRQDSSQRTTEVEK